jgi:methionyl-tRNA formyltransferase
VNLDGDASAIAPGTIIAIDPQNGLIVCCLGGRAVKLEVVYTSEGYFPGYKIGLFGVGQWGVFS